MSCSHGWKRAAIAAIAAATTSLAVAEMPARPESVSPGERTRLVDIEARCPTFSWALTPGARGSELVVLRLPAEGAGAGAEPVPILQKALSGGATAWTPALGDCLERGSAYAWVVRSIDEAGREPRAEDWSEPRLFRVSAAPSLADVDRALEVLRAYREATVGDGVAPRARIDSPRSARPRGEASGSQGARPVAESGDAIAGVVFDAVAVEGEVAGAAGVNVGVHGLSASADAFAAGVVGEATATAGFTIGTIGSSASPGGAGVAAFATDPVGGVGLFARAEGTAGTAIDAEADADTGTAIGILARSSAPGGAALKVAHRDPAGGPDLILDGSEQLVTDTVLTESGLTRSSGSAETFSFANPGGGTLSLTVDGVDVVTSATDQDTLGGLACAEGEVAKLSSGSWACATDDGESYSAGNQLELSGTTFNVLEGASSGLDADSLDGLDSSQLAPASHLHTGADIVPGSLGTATLADGAVTGAKILDGSISLDDLPGDAVCPPGTYLHKYLDSLGGWACESFQTLADLLQLYYPPEPPSLFGTFGGGNYSGTGDVVISTPQPYSGVHTVANFTIAPGGSAIVDSGFLFVGAQGRCTIQGSIEANAVIVGGSPVPAPGAAVGKSGRRANFVEAGFGMAGSLATLPVDLALSGPGGGGGGANAGGGAATSLIARGGSGGGAAGGGGSGGCVGCASLNGGNGLVDYAKRSRLTGGEFQGHPARTDNFAPLLLFPGASGGSGAVGAGGGTGGGGGDAGGVVYLECNELEFTGSIDVSGDDGGPGIGDAGGGGGGGGGVILIRYRTLIGTVTGTVDIAGGAGGPGAGSGGNGGAGGGGFADVVGLQ